jgi:hypothetical protein
MICRRPALHGAKRPLPTLSRLRELFDFEPGIGLRWKVARGSAAAGRRAGGRHHSGISRIGIDRASFRLDMIIELARNELEQRP